MSTALPHTFRFRHPSFLTDETSQSNAKQVIQQLAEKYSHATKNTIYQSGMDLSKCTRLLPQDNDTGGFFVALFRKNRDIGIKAISV